MLGQAIVGMLAPWVLMGSVPAPGSAIASRTEAAPLYHVRLGEAGGIPLIVANGGPGYDHSYMLETPIWSQIARDRQVVLYDQRGTGRSPGADGGELTLARMVDDLEALRQSLKVERIDLLGHSWGGVLSMAYAIRHPGRVRRLVLVGSADANFAENEYLFDKLYPDVMASFPDDPSPAGRMGCVSVHLYESMSFYDQRNRPPVSAAPDNTRFSSKTCTEVMLDVINHDLSPHLSRLQVPTLVMNGRFDANVAPSVAYRLAKAIPGAKLVYFERSGHFPFVEEPDRFALLLGRFLDGQE